MILILNSFLIHVILKRTSNQKISPENELKVGNLKLKAIERTISCNSESLSLSQKESTLLQLLFENLNEVVPRKTLMNDAWGNDDFFTSKSLDVYLTKIRKILSLDSNLKLINIHGFGYKLVEQG